MTHARALQIIINAAGRDCIGVGRGIRSLPSDAEKCRLAEAVAKVYPKAYGREVTDQDMWKLGLDRYKKREAP